MIKWCSINRAGQWRGGVLIVQWLVVESLHQSYNLSGETLQLQNQTGSSRTSGSRCSSTHPFWSIESVPTSAHPLSPRTGGGAPCCLFQHLPLTERGVSTHVATVIQSQSIVASLRASQWVHPGRGARTLWCGVFTAPRLCLRRPPFWRGVTAAGSSERAQWRPLHNGALQQHELGSF